jgi:hypothetical protein
LPGFPCLAQNIEREALMDVVSLVVAKKEHVYVFAKEMF